MSLCIPLYLKLFNTILDTGIIPEIWTIGISMYIYTNKGDRNNPGSHRRIALVSSQLYRHLIEMAHTIQIANWYTVCRWYFFSFGHIIYGFSLHFRYLQTFLVRHSLQQTISLTNTTHTETHSLPFHCLRTDDNQRGKHVLKSFLHKR